MENAMNPPERKEEGTALGAYIRSIPGKLQSAAMTVWELGRNDFRRVVHSLKMGLALTLVSLMYFLRPLYDVYGQAGMWAVLTVVVVFEFTAGGTIYKSINRGCATLVAGALGIAAENLASLCGDRGKPIVLGILIFLVAAAATFSRFFPAVKRRYDYGMMIFIMTFSLVAVSGIRVTQVLTVFHQRLTTVLIGVSTCLLISLFIYPVWAGQDLHFLVASNLQKLAVFLEGLGDVLDKDLGGVSDKSYLQSHKSILTSKGTEESLANFAWWEPCHGKFKFRHPWKQYLNIGTQARECANLIELLTGSINPPFQPKVATEVQAEIQRSLIQMSRESSKVLKELSSAIKDMVYPSQLISTHTQAYRAASDDLQAILQTPTLPTEAGSLHDLLPLLVAASALTDILNSVDGIVLSTDELARKAHFQSSPPEAHRKQQRGGAVKPVDDGSQVVIEIPQPPRVPETKDGVPGA